MKEKFKTSIGGQALIEGIMMRGPKTTAMSVRLPSGEIDTETWQTKAPSAWYRKTPFVRGIFNMVDSLLVGYRCLMKSAEKAGFEDDDAEPSKFERWLSDKLGKNLMTVMSYVALVVGVAIALGLFSLLPTFLVGLVSRWISHDIVRSLVEGLVKMGIFVAYLAAVARMGEIKRVFQYHGAEHKTIACYESGSPLTVEDIRGCTRFHPRCGTSFLIIVLIISVLLFSVITWEYLVVRVILKILLLPVVVGVAYELIKLAGRHDNAFTRIISAPGMWLQRLTTNEPDDSQIEVAIEAMKAVIPNEDGADAW